MPHYSVVIGPQGPLITVIVSTTAARRTALVAAGQPIPNPSIVQLLIDTGAFMTAIDSSVITQLGLQATGTTGILTPSTGATPHQCNTFDVELLIPGYMPSKHVPALPVIDGHYLTQGHSGLLGRDVLKDARLLYSGHDGLAFLSF